jgi:hypothetical protein
MRNFLSGSGGSDSLPDPSVARFAMWSADQSGGTADTGFITMNEDPALGGGDETIGFIAPGAGNGAMVTYSFAGGNGELLGVNFAYPGRNTTFKARLSLTYANIGAGATYVIGFGSQEGITDPRTADGVFLTVTKVNGDIFGTFQLATSVGGSTTQTDTGILCPFDTEFDLVLTLINGLASLAVTFDGSTYSATSQDNIPVAPCGVRCAWIGVGGVYDNTIALEYMYLTNETP